MAKRGRPDWVMIRRKDRYQTLTTGDGFHEFSRLPSVWARMSHALCCFCRRGWAEGLKGLWAFGESWVCTDCARDIVEEKMPVGWVE